MARIKRGVASKKRHKRILKQAKGYYGNRSRSFRVANQAVMRAGQNAYAHRKMRKRDFRKLWISRINAGARNHGLTYSNLIHGLKVAKVDINRKMLADLAVNDEAAFADLCSLAKENI